MKEASLSSTTKHNLSQLSFMPVAFLSKEAHWDATNLAGKAPKPGKIQPVTAILDLIQLKCDFDSDVKHPIKNKTTPDKAEQ